VADAHSHTSPSDVRWLGSVWPFVRKHLPPSPADVLEIGCGPLGGFVPALRSTGYRALGIDPEAPAGGDYRRTEFERHPVERPVDAIVASTSLHHVGNLPDVVDRIASAIRPDGVLIVIEWASERFDESTARWCFDRLAEDREPGWLDDHRKGWQESGKSWDTYRAEWARTERLHAGQDVLQALQVRFDTRWVSAGPCFFPELDDVTEADEQAAIDTGRIQANGIRFVGQLRPTPQGGNAPFLC
jgi:SAM-dependent methyltransferase